MVEWYTLEGRGGTCHRLESNKTEAQEMRCDSYTSPPDLSGVFQAPFSPYGGFPSGFATHAAVGDHIVYLLPLSYSGLLFNSIPSIMMGA